MVDAVTERAGIDAPRFGDVLFRVKNSLIPDCFLSDQRLCIQRFQHDGGVIFESDVNSHVFLSRSQGK